MFTKSFLAAFFAAVVAAQDNLDNPTSAPQLNEVIAGCKPFTLAWTPTTAGTVSIELLSGPDPGSLHSAGIIATGIANSGTFSFTPGASLAAQAVTGYKIINDLNSQFQWSVPFSVSPCVGQETPVAPTSAVSPVAPTSAVSATSVDGYATGSPAVPTPEVPTTSCSSTITSTVYVSPSVGTGYPVAPSAPAAGTGYPVAPAPPAGTGYPVAPAPPAGTGYPVAPAPPAGTGYPVAPVVPSGPAAPYPVTSPATTLYPTASGTGSGVYPTAPPPEFTGAASAVKAGLSFAGAAAAFAFML